MSLLFTPTPLAPAGLDALDPHEARLQEALAPANVALAEAGRAFVPVSIAIDEETGHVVLGSSAASTAGNPLFRAAADAVAALNAVITALDSEGRSAMLAVTPDLGAVLKLRGFACREIIS